MVLLKQYQEIIERETATISSTFKALHITIFIIAAIAGMTTAFSFGKILESFKYNCVLNAEIVFLPNTFLESNLTKTTIHMKTTTESIISNETSTTPVPITTEHNDEDDNKFHAIDLSHSIWGTNNLCNFCQFSQLVSMIFAIIWGAFFVIIAKGGGGNVSDILPQPWRIVYPCIFFCTICSIILVVSTIKLTSGFTWFCLEFEPELNNTKCVSEIEVYTKQFRETDGIFLSHYYFVVIFAYINLFAWIAQLLVLILRVISFVDFELYIINITEKSDEEIVKNVVEYRDEPETSRYPTVSQAKYTDESKAKKKDDDHSNDKQVKQSDANSQAKQSDASQAKQSDANQAQQSVANQAKSDAKQMKQSEANQAKQMKQSEANQAKQSEAKQSEAKQTDVNQAQQSVPISQVKQSGINQSNKSDANEANTSQNMDDRAFDELMIKLRRYTRDMNKLRFQ